MGVYTTILNLFKPATSDFVDVVADLNANFDKIEAEAISQRAKTQASQINTGTCNFTGGNNNVVSLVLPVGVWMVTARGRYNWSTSGNPAFYIDLYDGTSVIDRLDMNMVAAGGLYHTGVVMGKVTVSSGTKNITFRAGTASPGNGSQLLDQGIMMVWCVA